MLRFHEDDRSTMTLHLPGVFLGLTHHAAGYNPGTILRCERSQHIASCSTLRAEKIGDGIALSVVDGVLPGDDWQLGSLTKPMRKPSFMPVMRYSTHSRVGCDCSVGANASATKGVEIGAASTMGGTVGGAPWCSPPSRWIWQNCRARSGTTMVYANISGAGPEPE